MLHAAVTKIKGIFIVIVSVLQPKMVSIYTYGAVLKYLFEA